jgi:hypothetical protein
MHYAPAFLAVMPSRPRSRRWRRWLRLLARARRLDQKCHFLPLTGAKSTSFCP